MRRLVAILALILACLGNAHAQTVSDTPTILGIYALDSARCIVHKSSAVIYTDDRGQSWQTLAQSDPLYPFGFSVSNSACRPMVISMPRYESPYTYLDLLESTDDGRTWKADTIDVWRYLPTEFRTVPPVGVHRTPRDSVLLFYKTILCRITRPVAWPALDLLPLPDTARSIAARDDSVFLASDNGLYLSTDAGTSWMQRYAGRIHECVFSQGNHILLLTDGVRLLSSDDAGVTWDTIPRPIADHPIRNENRRIQVTEYADGNNRRLCLAIHSTFTPEGTSWYRGEDIVLEYVAAERRWIRVEVNEAPLIDLQPYGWAHPAVCWGILGYGPKYFEPETHPASEQLSGFDQSTFTRRRIRLNWYEQDDELYRQGQLERAYNGGPWESIGVLSPPASFHTSTYIDSTVAQDWSGAHAYQYRLIKQFTDGRTRIYESLPIPLNNDSVFLDLVEYILPPAATWMHYSDENGKRHSVMLRSREDVDDLQTSILFRYMIDYVDGEDRQYDVYHLRDDFLLSTRSFGEFYDATKIKRMDGGALEDIGYPGTRRWVHIPRRDGVPPDSIAFEFYPMGRPPVEIIRREAIYSRDHGLLQSRWVCTYEKTGTILRYVLKLEFATTNMDVPSAPTLYQLAPPWPNPFHTGVGAVATVSVRSAADASVRLRLFDLHGRMVRSLHEGFLPGGSHVFTWDGRGEHGRSLSPGLYFCLFEHRDGIQSQSVLLLSAR